MDWAEAKAKEKEKRSLYTDERQPTARTTLFFRFITDKLHIELIFKQLHITNPRG
ncbi:MAG: hypothetical protein OFPII_37350 [Osedax symbiont Rs1]|nr:MAG: hypothetical protein OFPII_37350 [Osedax symbiont Rs1]